MLNGLTAADSVPETAVFHPHHGQHIAHEFGKEKELTFLHTRFGRRAGQSSGRVGVNWPPIQFPHCIAVRYRDFYSKGRDMPTLAVPQPKTADGTNSPNGFREGRLLKQTRVNSRDRETDERDEACM